MAKVVITGKIPQVAVERLRAEHDVTSWDADVTIERAELLGRVKGAEALLSLLTEKVDAELLDAAGPQLKVVSNVAVGYNNIDVAACTRAGDGAGTAAAARIGHADAPPPCRQALT